MITLTRNGIYKLAETRRHTKILYLNNDVFAWVESPKIGEMLVLGSRTQPIDTVLSVGDFCLYEVESEPDLFDQQHLELEAGDHVWQGYLLLTGLPDRHKKRGRIIPTSELITGNPEYAERSDVTTVLAAIK